MFQRSSLRWVFLLLAIWGAVHPMAYFLAWFAENGFDLAGMIDAWHVNDATSGLVWDLTISAFALTLWVVVESLRHRQLHWLLAVPATFCIGVSCGLPLFLFFLFGRGHKNSSSLHG